MKPIDAANINTGNPIVITTKATGRKINANNIVEVMESIPRFFFFFLFSFCCSWSIVVNDSMVNQSSSTIQWSMIGASERSNEAMYVSLVIHGKYDEQTFVAIVPKVIMCVHQPKN